MLRNLQKLFVQSPMTREDGQTDMENEDEEEAEEEEGEDAEGEEEEEEEAGVNDPRKRIQ